MRRNRQMPRSDGLIMNFSRQCISWSWGRISCYDLSVLIYLKMHQGRLLPTVVQDAELPESYATR